MLTSKFAVKSVYAEAVSAQVKCIDILECLNTIVSKYYIAFRKKEKFYGVCEYIPLKKQFFCITSEQSPDEILICLLEFFAKLASSDSITWEEIESLELNKDFAQWQTK